MQRDHTRETSVYLLLFLGQIVEPFYSIPIWTVQSKQMCQIDIVVSSTNGFMVVLAEKAGYYDPI
jgi:hypothetical protein